MLWSWRFLWDQACRHRPLRARTALCLLPALPIAAGPGPICLLFLPADGSASQVQHLPSSQVLSPDEAVCLRKKKRHPRQDPFARLSALKDDLCHRQLPEDQTAILNSVDHDDASGHATLL